MRKSVSGFTIVELLIVIVVIAILAAISVVAYAGIQQRAKNSAIINAASSTIRLVQSYIASEGTYPVPTNATSVLCVTSETLCSDTAGNAINPSSTFDANIAKIGQPPRGVPNSGSDKYGILATHWRGNSFLIDNGAFYVSYWLQGVNQQCELSPVLNTGMSGYVTTGNTYPNISNSGKTMCVIHIPLAS